MMLTTTMVKNGAPWPLSSVSRGSREGSGRLLDGLYRLSVMLELIALTTFFGQHALARCGIRGDTCHAGTD